MRVNPCNLRKINNIQNTNNKPVFKSKFVNGHEYSDDVYKDALDYKDIGFVEVSFFRDRYGFWTYYFTDKAFDHVLNVNLCIDDMHKEAKKINSTKIK